LRKYFEDLLRARHKELKWLLYIEGKKLEGLTLLREKAGWRPHRSGLIQDFRGGKSWERSVRPVEDCGYEGMEAQHVHRIKESPLSRWHLMIEFLISFFKVF